MVFRYPLIPAFVWMHASLRQILRGLKENQKGAGGATGKDQASRLLKAWDTDYFMAAARAKAGAARINKQFQE